MKKSTKMILLLIAVSMATVFFNCKSSTTESQTDPFNTGEEERNLLVVISDIHLGADLSYAEINKNLGSLEKFLIQVKNGKNVKELIIAGDVVDEWFIPAPLDPYKGKDQADFVQRVKAANKGVFDVLNSIIQEGKIHVAYVPGNHDLTVTAASIESILPGITQVRDPELGLGTYSPSDNPKVAIEHGHRYNFFCAPDPFSNQKIAPNTISPPGYFFTRIAAQYFAQNKPAPGDTIKPITKNNSGNESQQLLYDYYKVWEWSLNLLTIKNKFDEKLIVTNFDGFTQTFAVNDLVPFQKTPGGEIDVVLFKGIQDTWNQRQIHNRVPVPIPTQQAIRGSGVDVETDNQAKTQYFLNPNSDKRIVIFGHTHIAKIEVSNNYKGEKSIYANSGTWIDHNSVGSTRNFLIITPQTSDPATRTTVSLYNYDNDTANKMAEESIRY